MALKTATITFHVHYSSDEDLMPTDEDLLLAYQGLEDYVAGDSVLSTGAHDVSFELGGQGGD